MSNIIIKDLTFGYDGNPDTVFENLNAVLDTDWKLGLVGRNGKGKTTLLKLIMGKYEYKGKISANVNFEYFPLEIKSENLTVREVLFSINEEFEEWEVLKELKLLDVGDDIFERQFCALSKGEQTKVLLAALFNKTNAFLLIDEPTNHLDLSGRAALAKFLNKKSGFIIISHDRAFLDGCIDHVMSLNRSTVDIQSGNMSTFLENKRLQDEFEISQNEKLQKEIKRLSDAKKRTAQWSDKAESEKFCGKNESGLRPDRGHLGAKSAKIMKRATETQKRIDNSLEEKSALLKNIDRTDSIKVNPLDYSQDRLLTFKNLSVIYDGKPIFAPVSFEVLSGERVWLKGKNGCGKSSIIKAVLGQISNYEGQIFKGAKLKISYVSQDTSFLFGAIDEFCESKQINKTKLLTFLNKLGIEKKDFEKDISLFSEGQKKKLLIASSLCDESNLYIWDEPLNYIDIISRKQIRDMILSSCPTLVFVEHDKYFCENIATKIVEIQGGMSDTVL